MHTVSVVVPVYNVEDYINACIDSLLTQDYANTEIILVDDGSTDASGKICDDYAQNNPSIIALHKSNGGLSSARNYGMDHATGDYALFVDSDDIIAPNTLSSCMKAVLQSGAETDCVVFTYVLIDEEGKKLGTDAEADTFPRNVCVSGNEALTYLLEDRIQNFAWRMLFSTEMWQNSGIRFPLNRLFEDVLTTYKFFMHSGKVTFLDERLYGYRQRAQSILHNITARTAESYREAFIERSNTIEKVLPKLHGLCEAQRYKAFYRVAMFTLTSTQQSVLEVRDKSISYLKKNRPSASTLEIFNRKQRITLSLLRRMPVKSIAKTIALAKKVQLAISSR